MPRAGPNGQPAPGTAILAISQRGSELARSLATAISGENTLYLDQRFRTEHERAEAFDLPVRPVVHKIFGEYDRLVLFMPVGSAVRLLAPYLEGKHRDPAVVCVDDAGQFAVSLLSGHLGGADRFAEEVARTIGATPVITSASYVTGTLAVDLLGQEYGWQLEADSLAVTRASAAVVNREPIGVYQDAGERDWWPANNPLPANIQVYPTLDSLEDSSCAAALIISDAQLSLENKFLDRPSGVDAKPLVFYRPPTLVIGMGCRRGVPAGELEQLLIDTFQQHQLALGSIKCIATAQLKADEAGILELAARYGVPLVCYSSEELNGVFSAAPEPTQAGPTPSPKAHDLVGVWGVSEPAALLGAHTDRLLVPRIKTSRATIAVARVSFD